MPSVDAAIIGAGPNGLAAGIVLAQAGLSVTIFEAQPTIGGGVRSAELTVPGFVHDVCSAVYPMAAASPFFRSLPLATYGLEWIEPSAMLAHPFDDGTAAIVERSVDQTADSLGGRDARRYRELIGEVVAQWRNLERHVLGPIAWPHHPLTLARFGLHALQSARGLARQTFESTHARALFAGICAHGMLPLDKRPTAGFGLVLGALAHVVGWVIPRRGAQSLADALAAHFRALGGSIVTGTHVTSLNELPPASIVLCDLSPRPFLSVAGDRLPRSYQRKLQRYRYGMGVFKVDWALSDPIPWRAKACARSATVHIGGTLEELVESEHSAWNGSIAERPFVLLVQPTLFDSTRAPHGRHTAWAYCHVPRGSDANMLARIEQQIERFAPGFRDCVLARSVMTPSDIERGNPNFVGGDIGAGATDLGQLFLRPNRHMYSTPVRGLYLCSASTPPGVSVHGMCGYFAAKRALKHVHAR